MAYNLIAEFSREPDWQELHKLAATLNVVECFPIPRDGTEPASLGVSVPRKSANLRGWAELEVFLQQLWGHGALIVDLYAGTEVLRKDLSALKASLLDPG